jgi:glutathione S-transferase
MPDRLLVIGNRNYSSWSLRPWLVLKALGLPSTVVRIPLDRPDTVERIRQYSTAGRVPVLVEDGITVWDSLAIIEHLAEAHPGLWPSEPAARAMARSISAEMHSGFLALRNDLPMNIRATGRRIDLALATRADIDRIIAIWLDARQRFGADGPWLFGAWSAADAMYTPVASRFATYGIDLPAALEAYRTTALEAPAMQEWTALARAESEHIEHEEVGR